MEFDNKNTEQNLFEDALQLLNNGHRMIYVFKYVRDRAENDEMRQRIMDKIKENEQAQEINQARLEAATTEQRFTWTEIIIGSGMLGLALVLTKAIWHMGYISTIPMVIACSILGIFGYRRRSNF